MRVLTITSGTIFLLTVTLYYIGTALPIQITSGTLKHILTLFGLLNTFGLMILIFSYKWTERIKSKIKRGLIWGLVILTIAHNFIWTIIQMNMPNYKDVEIVNVDTNNERRKTITEHADRGVFGDYYRTVRVYELTSFLRLIETETKIR